MGLCLPPSTNGVHLLPLKLAEVRGFLDEQEAAEVTLCDLQVRS